MSDAEHDCKQEFSVGDLIKLKGDDSLAHGIGLILDKRDDSTDIIKDFLSELGVDHDTSEEIDSALEQANEYLLNTSVYLVFWQGGTSKDVFKNIWMFYNEIELLSKVTTPGR